MILVSFLLFVGAAVSALLQGLNIYLVLPLMLFGVFGLTMATIIREHTRVSPRTDQSDSDFGTKEQDNGEESALLS